jgi:hypothetical protein
VNQYMFSAYGSVMLVRAITIAYKLGVFSMS